MQILLKTPRLVLRQFGEADADHLFALDNDAEVMRFLNGGIPIAREVIVNEILPRFRHRDAKAPHFGFWALQEKESGNFAGWVSFRPVEDSAEEVALGYRLCRAVWGRGYATEAAAALVNKGFSDLGVQRVVATTYEENRTSRRVLEKLGMRLVRRFRLTPEDLVQTDTFQVDAVDVWEGDDLEYALEKADWQNRPGANNVR